MITRTLLIGALFLITALSSTACEEDHDLGRACSDDRDCEGRCVEGKDFPGGMCTFDCGDTRDCPGGWLCIDKKGGVCAELCDSSRECRDHFDGDWRCHDEKIKGDGDKGPVCVGD